MSVLICVSILLVSYTVLADDKLQCKDENNAAVDWYVLYKLPKDPESTNPLIRKGLGYIYMTNETVSKGWQLSTQSIGSTVSMPGVTLKPIYEDNSPDSKLWVMYNDNPANDIAASARNGHTKGVVVTDKDQGFWLIHSVPAYPPTPSGGETRPRRKDAKEIRLDTDANDGKYNYPPTGQLYGQSFFCVSLGSDQFEAVGKQFQYNQIIVYRKNVPEALGEQYPVLKDAANQVRIRKEPYNSKTTLTTLKGVNLVSFAKTDKWNKDLYDEYIAPELGVDVYVQTWLNGRGRLPSECGSKKVYNIKSITIKQGNANFQSGRDHSKWAVAVSDKGKKSWVCIADINRADTQYNRGGGALCMNNKDLWKNYRNIVKDVEPCPP